MAKPRAIDNQEPLQTLAKRAARSAASCNKHDNFLPFLFYHGKNLKNTIFCAENQPVQASNTPQKLSFEIELLDFGQIEFPPKCWGKKPGLLC